MGVWKGFQCLNACADAVTASRMAVDVPAMWHYVLPYELFNAFQANKIADRIAYKHIDANLRYKPAMSAHRWHETLAFLGLND